MTSVASSPFTVRASPQTAVTSRSYRGAQLTRDLIAARIARACEFGVDRLWLRCVEGSPAHRLYEANGWTWWARTEFVGPAACQKAVLLALPVRRFQDVNRHHGQDDAPPV
jgi:hypothetical protein